MIPWPCKDCRWFDACAHINADCEGRQRAAVGLTWDAEQRQPRRHGQPLTEQELVQATADAAARYEEVKVLQREAAEGKERAAHQNDYMAEDEAEAA